jgi:hypothetical protein
MIVQAHLLPTHPRSGARGCPAIRNSVCIYCCICQANAVELHARKDSTRPFLAAEYAFVSFRVGISEGDICELRHNLVLQTANVGIVAVHVDMWHM